MTVVTVVTFASVEDSELEPAQVERLLRSELSQLSPWEKTLNILKNILKNIQITLGSPWTSHHIGIASPWAEERSSCAGCDSPAPSGPGPSNSSSSSSSIGSGRDSALELKESDINSTHNAGKVDRILVKQKSKWDVQNSLALRGVTWSRCRYLPRYLRVSFRCGRNLLEVQPWKLPVSETPLSPEGPEGQVHKFLTTSRHGHVQFKASQAKEAGTARCDSGLLLSIEILTLQCLEMPSWIQVDLKLIVYIVFWVWMGLGECLGTIGGTKMEIIAERCFSTGKPWTFVCIQPLQFPDVEITWRQHWHDVDGTLTGHWRDIDRTLTCMEYAGDNSEVSCGGWRHHSKLEEKYILHAYKRKHVCSHFRKPTVASLFRIWLPAMKLASAPNCLEILQPRSALSPSNDWCTLIPLVGVDPFLPNVVCPSLQRRCLMLKRAGDCAAACEESLVGSSRGGRRLQTSVHLTD